MIHDFQFSIEGITLPDKFTCPFCYTPHTLCVKAAEEVQDYLNKQSQWAVELAEGKMFGVLVVRTKTGDIGYLAAYSGNLAHSNKHEYFVPHVFDLLNPEGFFVVEEKLISKINEDIEKILKENAYSALKEQLAEESLLSEQKIKKAKEDVKLAKIERDKRRESNPDENVLEEMIRESQFYKAELKRLECSTQERMGALRQQLDAYENKINALREERKNRSFALQRKLFDSFRVLNVKGEEKSLYDIFEETVGKLPPAGAGECAAPKLLQYAYRFDMRPLAMAEFWWEKPVVSVFLEHTDGDGLRRHGSFYPACKSKCEPILNFMTQGLDVDVNPMHKNSLYETNVSCKGHMCSDALEIVFEDEWLVAVNKPAGMLSVPGKGSNEDSVYSIIRQRYPDASGPLIVHRLDMDTSGLMVIAKTKDIHKEMQKLFASGCIEKCYIAILDGTVNSEGKSNNDEGEILLPLCLDPEDRPRQIVNYEHGKPAITRYKILEQTENNQTKILFYPKTGRTHQLRVHAAHRKGLNTPIKGDRLYGQPSDRLYLHAKSLKFTHPETGMDICVEREADF